MLFPFLPAFAASAPPPNGSSTTLSRSSAFFLGNTSTPDYYTIPTAGLAYPSTDWAEIFLIKVNNSASAATQYLLCSGNTGSAAAVSLFITSQSLGYILINQGGSAEDFLEPAGTPLVPSIANNAGWYVVCLRSVSGNVELATCPLNGTASTLSSHARTATGAITPGQSNLTIGTRFDVSTGTHLTKNNIAWYARVNGTVTNTQLQNLAAGQDIMADLGLSPLCYINFNSSGTTIADSSGNGNTATKHNNPVLRGGPSFSTAPITIDNTFDNWYARVFQRVVGGSTKTLTATGKYTGSPTKIMVRVIDKTGTQVVAPVKASTPSPGIWSATLTVPQGAEYTLEAYHGNNNAKIARSQQPWGVGAIFLLSGESISDQQAQNTYNESGFTPDLEQLSIYDQPDSWQPSHTYSTPTTITDPDTSAVYGLNTAGNGYTSGSVSFTADRVANPGYWTKLDLATQATDSINATNGVVLHTIERLRANLGVPVMAAIGAKTGSQLVNTPNNWNTYSDPVTHGKLKACIANVGGDAEILGWNQGANDANAPVPPSASSYQTDLQNVIPQIRTYLTSRAAATLPAFISIVGRNASNNSSADSGWRAVRNGIMAAIPNITNAYEAGALWDLTHSDALHPDPTTTGYFRACKRMAQAILNYMLPGSFTTGMTAATVASASISGSHTIDVVFTLNTGTTLQGLTGATGLTGFVVKDGSSSAQTITATSIPSANTVRLTFSGTPVSGWSVDYIPTEAPDITNLLYTNGSVIADTAGVPVHAFTAPITL